MLPDWSDSPPCTGASCRVPGGSTLLGREYAFLGRAGLELVEGDIGNLRGWDSGPLLVIHGTGCRRFDPGAMLAAMEYMGSDLVIAAFPGDLPTAALLTMPDGRVSEAGGSAGTETNIRDSGVWLMGSGAVRAIPPEPASSPSEMLARILQAGARVHSDILASYARILGRWEDYLLLCHDMLTGADESLPGNHAGADRVLVEDASLGRGAVLRGSCWVAGGAVVGDGCELTDCVVMERAHVEEGCTMRNSLVLAGARVPCGTVKTDKYLGVFGR